MLRYSGVPKEHPDVNDMTTSASIESSMERSQSILSSSALNWYALRITYGRELALQEYLNSEGIENFSRRMCWFTRSSEIWSRFSGVSMHCPFSRW